MDIILNNLCLWIYHNNNRRRAWDRRNLLCLAVMRGRVVTLLYQCLFADRDNGRSGDDAICSSHCDHLQHFFFCKTGRFWSFGAFLSWSHGMDTIVVKDEYAMERGTSSTLSWFGQTMWWDRVGTRHPGEQRARAMSWFGGKYLCYGGRSIEHHLMHSNSLTNISSNPLSNTYCNPIWQSLGSILGHPLKHSH